MPCIAKYSATEGEEREKNRFNICHIAFSRLILFVYRLRQTNAYHSSQHSDGRK